MLGAVSTQAQVHPFTSPFLKVCLLYLSHSHQDMLVCGLPSDWVVI